MGSLKFRFTTILFVILVGVMWLLPSTMQKPYSWLPSDKLNYGLDIQGGLQLVMGVNIDEALEALTKSQARALQRDLDEEKLQAKIEASADSANEIFVDLQDAAIADRISGLIEHRYPGILLVEKSSVERIKVQFQNTYLEQHKTRLIEQAIETIRNRIDEFGVAEPSITAQGSNRILIQLPGLEDANRAKELINKTAKLDFMLVSRELPPERLQEMIQKAEVSGGYNIDQLKYSAYIERLNRDLKELLPPNTVVYFEREERKSKGSGQDSKTPYLLRTDVSLSGDALEDARVSMNQYGAPEVAIAFNPTGAKGFETLTGEHVGEQLAVVLDKVVKSAPAIQSKIGGGRGVITLGSARGKDQMEEAKLIATALRAGALPVSLEQLEERTVGPSLGADSIQKGKIAAAVGCALVFIFMIAWYGVFGLIADFALGLNIVLLLSILASLKATLTLPGVAGIALTVGMAVDANIVIFERIKEELRKGLSLVAAIREGYNRAFMSIFDSNITTVGTSVVLIYFGTGAVRGFAVSLIAGLTVSMFTAIFVTRAILDLLSGPLNLKKVPISWRPIKIDKDPRMDSPGRFDFVGKYVWFSGLSAVLVVASIWLISAKGLNYGIDFAGGTELQLQFSKPVAAETVRTSLSGVDRNDVQVQALENNEYVIRFGTVEGKSEKEISANTDALIREMTGKLGSSITDAQLEVRRVDSVGPAIGSELKRNSLLAGFYSLLLIMIYVGFRFDMKFAPGAVICLFHDAVLTMGFFCFLGKEFNVQIMAAIMTLIGFSINDTIITYDRIRENLPFYREKSLAFIINRSINDMLGRTILTSLTTFMATGALYYLAGGVIEDFALAFGFGIIVGVYSSIYVAAPLTLLFEKIQKKVI